MTVQFSLGTSKLDLLSFTYTLKTIAAAPLTGSKSQNPLIVSSLWKMKKKSKAQSISTFLFQALLTKTSDSGILEICQAITTSLARCLLRTIRVKTLKGIETSKRYLRIKKLGALWKKITTASKEMLLLVFASIQIRLRWLQPTQREESCFVMCLKLIGLKMETVMLKP